MVLSNDYDLLNPPAELEKRKHKLKRLVQSPNSFFMDVKCQGCFNILWWCAATARRCCANPPAAAPDLQKAALSEERVTNVLDTIYPVCILEWVNMVVMADLLSENVRRWFFGLNVVSFGF
ncbi:UNVERIFIED_CONTAM: 40S ribosomal protein S27-1 [Sesamum latifolium]|uniref:40S ribosomal protein S27-1 n=1 Tax=Sesamum latifolium TaxID=2727402 RepID=A0AAW2VWY6_9LAMI